MSGMKSPVTSRTGDPAKTDGFRAGVPDTDGGPLGMNSENVLAPSLNSLRMFVVNSDSCWTLIPMIRYNPRAEQVLIS